MARRHPSLGLPGRRLTPITFCVRGVISPLLANVYMNRYLKVFRLRGLDRRYGARLVNYADDCAPRRRREEAWM